MDRWWKGYLLVVAALATAWVLVPSVLAQDVLYQAIGLLSVAAVVLGAVRRQTRCHRAWYLLALGQLMLVLGDGMYAWYQDVQNINPFPSPADAVYLSAYPVLAASLVMLTRCRRTGWDRGGWVDSGVVVVSLGLIAWVVVGAPTLAEQGPTFPALLSLAYPACDLLLLAVASRLFVGAGARPTAFRLLFCSLAALMSADVVYTLLGSVSNRWLDATWLTSYVLAGAAAMHRSAGAVSEPSVETRTMSTRRVVGLLGALLVAPGIEGVEHLMGRELDTWPLIAGYAVLTTLAVARLQLALVEARAAAAERAVVLDRLAHEATHDALTGAMNRASTLAEVEKALADVRPGAPVGLLYVDLDHFKQVNDTFGHVVGDEVLRSVVARIREVVRPEDVVGRIGGDEIVVLVRAVPSQRALVDMASRIVAAVERPLRLEGQPQALWLSASVGVAFSHEGMVDPDDLVREADAGAYQAKAEGRARVQVFGEELRKELTERADAEAAVRHALVAGELVMHYQPLLELSTGSVVGYEALARWQRPGHGLLPPSEFIPLAEKSSLICDIGRWALYEAMAQAAAWDREGRPHVHMSVNVSGRHLMSAVIVDDVVGACVAAGVAPERLVLEVTETVPLSSPVMQAQLTTLRRLGVGIHIDDFGTGYTSIGQLRNLPASALKIDRSLIALDDVGSRELVALAVHAAHSAGLQVVAEGVETAAQMVALRAMGCDLAQGFHIARPAPADEVSVSLGARYRTELEPAVSDPSRTTPV
ncbi:putative bifunctional diguanylate cyclase/phosphodiesterase [Cellulomonas sp. SG140]|uniref:putative bifunctional diguanylate cyclase/phosphodiesterase n=1 Tax=Cellulomonas sp. SG140 TaxID=2976536 RepID=UPI0021E74857|nr:EAL domain-containing protein [Cellulomonas sp. SG140]